VIISAAAYTAVDKAEEEPELAFLTNSEGPAVLARAARNSGAPIIHLSTDYVFNGCLDRPYNEDDIVSPLGVYGNSKLSGEEAVRASGANYMILRTAWVYSPFGANFLTTMLRVAQSRDEISVVDDQIGSPTSAEDIADALLTAVAALRLANTGLNETYHLAGTGETSWAGFAEHIFSISRETGGAHAVVRRITTADWPTKAVRPSNSRLDCRKFERVFGYEAPLWTDSVEFVVKQLVRCTGSI
jgi:dTDP-4-dehydrorhamnose reductase